MRLVYSPEFSRLVALRATAEDMEQIALKEGIAANFIRRGEPFPTADMDFRGVVARASHNQVFMRMKPIMHESIMLATLAGGQLNQAMQQRGNRAALQNILHYHAEIVRYIRLRDGEGATLATRYHIKLGMEDMD